MKADKKNFAWDYDKDIKTIQAKRKTGLVGPPHIDIQLTNGKHSVFIQDKDRRDELIKLLQTVIGNKLTVEK